MTHSDHDPINIDLLSMAISRKVFRFKFENTWLEEPTFCKEVSDFWLSLPSTHVILKLLSVTNFFHKFRDKLAAQKEVLKSLVDRTDDEGLKKYIATKQKLEDLLFHEEV